MHVTRIWVLNNALEKNGSMLVGFRDLRVWVSAGRHGEEPLANSVKSIGELLLIHQCKDGLLGDLFLVHVHELGELLVAVHEGSSQSGNGHGNRRVSKGSCVVGCVLGRGLALVLLVGAGVGSGAGDSVSRRVGRRPHNVGDAILLGHMSNSIGCLCSQRSFSNSLDLMDEQAVVAMASL